MSRLADITTHKNTILQALINDDNIVKALGTDTVDFLDQPSISDPRDLLFNNIFPYCYVAENQEDQKSYITIMFRYKKSGRAFKVGSIGFYIFAHHDLLKTSYPHMRTDFIVNQIDELFHETTTLGIGRLQFNKMEDIKVSKYHSGTYLEYTNMDFD